MSTGGRISDPAQRDISWASYHPRTGAGNRATDSDFFVALDRTVVFGGAIGIRRSNGIVGSLCPGLGGVAGAGGGISLSHGHLYLSTDRSIAFDRVRLPLTTCSRRSTRGRVSGCHRWQLVGALAGNRVDRSPDGRSQRSTDGSAEAGSVRAGDSHGGRSGEREDLNMSLRLPARHPFLPGAARRANPRSASVVIA